MILTFFVPGIAVPKQSFRYAGHGRGYTDPRVTAWADRVAWAAHEAAQAACVNPLDGNLAVELVFTMPTRRRVDCDNLSKNVLDALKDIVWHDDAQVVDLHIRKVFDGEPGVKIGVGYAE